jgi:tRNA-specific 2-thiouridylase
LWNPIRIPRDGKIQVKIRSKSPKTYAEIFELNDSSGEVKIRFENPQKAVTPGQAAVFYDGDRVLGGGWIFSAV